MDERRRLALAVLIATCSLLGSSRAARAENADPPPEIEEDARYELFRHRPPASKEYLRATIEAVAVLGAGFAQYLANAGANSRDWDLGYDWASLRSKLTGESIRFDSNHFDTNFLTHPFAGLFYYFAARHNRLSIAESFAYTAAASTLWELVGEMREKASVNDLVFTPISGVAIGEPMTQIGMFFRRGRKWAPNAVFGFVFAPALTVHDLMDDVVPETAPELDRFGLPADVGHDLRFGVGAVVTEQAARDGGSRVYSDALLSIDLRVVNLPDYDRAGTHSRWFGQGNVATMHFAAAQSNERLGDLSLTAHVLPFGHHHDRVSRDVDGKLRGVQTIVGLDVGFEYDLHDYDRTKLGWMDRISLVTAGASGEHTAFFEGVRLRTRLDVMGTFGGVGAFALDAYKSALRTTDLGTVLKDEGYYYGAGLAVAPSFTVTYRGVEAGAAARFDGLKEIEVLDRNDASITRVAPASDQRAATRGWLRVTLPGDVVRLSGWLQRQQRDGQVGLARAKRAELSGGAVVELVF